jgi:hypothetical protein
MPMTPLRGLSAAAGAACRGRLAWLNRTEPLPAAAKVARVAVGAARDRPRIIASNPTIDALFTPYPLAARNRGTEPSRLLADGSCCFGIQVNAYPQLRHKSRQDVSERRANAGSYPELIEILAAGR